MKFSIALTIAVSLLLPIQANEGPFMIQLALFDKDGDGLKNNEDGCPNQAEDLDDFQDSDGCPEYDNDKDGIRDEMDKCPLRPEDRDGFQDNDGCPDLDNDGDNLPDDRDKCPNSKEDFDGYEDFDGCPDNDNDLDAIPDHMDRCPSDKEDKDGFQDNDGCPDVDNDQDGIPDARDRCPDKKENMNGIQDSDGCPDESVQQIPMGKMPLEGVRFVGRTAELELSSRAMLDQMAKQMEIYPETELEVTGHVDKSKYPEEDMHLARDMAQAIVDYLVSTGIGYERFTVSTSGSMRPIASNVTQRGREENRRIEIMRVR